MNLGRSKNTRPLCGKLHALYPYQRRCCFFHYFVTMKQSIDGVENVNDEEERLFCIPIPYKEKTLLRHVGVLTTVHHV